MGVKCGVNFVIVDLYYALLDWQVSSVAVVVILWLDSNKANSSFAPCLDSPTVIPRPRKSLEYILGIS